MFSIVIPLYNKGKYVSKAIESVLNQTVKEFEIILVDDGSTDKGVEIVESYEDERIKIIRQQNQGVSVARNNGILAAKYNYIAFLDADDLWNKDFLEKIKELIEKYPSAGAYGTAYKAVDINTGNEIYKKRYKMDKKYIITDNYFKYACNNLYLTASSAVVKKEVFDNVGYFPEGISTWEDTDMWCRIGLNYNVAFYNEQKIIYNQNIPGSNTRIYKEYFSPFFDKYEEYINKMCLKKEVVFYLKEYVAQHHIHNCIHYNQYNKNIRKSIALLYKYKYTKLYKKRWCRAFLATLLPSKVYKYILDRK